MNMANLLELRKQFKEHLIERGLKSVRKNIKDEEKRIGATEGFELCKRIDSMSQFQETIRNLREEATKLAFEIIGDKDGELIKRYWRLVYKAEQVDYVFQRLVCFDILFGLANRWKIPINYYRAKAMIDTIEVLREFGVLLKK